MAKLFRLSVVTADRTVFESQVEYVNLPTAFGSVGILARHAPMLCAVEKGIARCTLESGEICRIRVSDGVASVADNELTLLVTDAKIIEE
ncbi:MAG: ATP synthase F1 subunit epsilon [Oscillospiraceae bacterium]|nr:ATP synthase F1 subunit epsilon [Oscillospiraceae bacterium]